MTNTAVKEQRTIERAAPDFEAPPLPQDASPLTLGIAPVIFSSDTFSIGRLDPESHESIKELRRQHGTTHAFRFDSRDGMIANIGLQPGIEPLGDVSEARVGENLLLLAEAIQHQLRRWLSRNRTILRRYRPLICLGRRDRLLATALQELGVQTPDPRLDVLAKWSFDLRLLTPADPEHPPWLGLIADVGTSNVIDVTVTEVIERGFNPAGSYVGLLGDTDDSIPSSRLRLLGRIAGIEDKTLILDDLREDADSDRVGASDVFLEPRRETFDAVVRSFYPEVADDALIKLRRIRAPYLSGDRKLEKNQAYTRRAE